MVFQEFVGRQETHHDNISPRLVRGLAATLDFDLDGVAPGGVLPPLWHWMLFQEWAPASGLGVDGHPKRGGFLPPVHDLPRRMWAGGRVTFQGELKTGEDVSRTSTILKVTEKSGGSGRLVFVTVRHETSGPRGVAIVEEQDIVYRGAEGEAVKPAEPAPAVTAEAVTRQVLPDPVILFRYSALTGNGHRIHYDLDYATKEEGYPGLVVHGPLQATWLADHAVRMAGRKLKTFNYRGRRPAFHAKPLLLVGQRGQGGAIALETRDPSGAVCMAADAAFG